ncbi:threonine/serine exporter ThrE family protein [Shewanella waksmanii]|uniref:threonine/serine ThrE exporter family protein n=1 Tax=Shewanella waksmanii TaxID=213783 RepID=UPI003736F6BF
MDPQAFKAYRRFIVKLGKMLHKYGSPSFRLESYLIEVANHFGLNSSFISTPTSIIFMLRTSDQEDEYHHAVRMQPGEIDMAALSLTDEVAAALLAGEISLAAADQRLDEIDAMQPAYGKIQTLLAYCLASAAFAMLMGASLSEIGWSGLLGALTYIGILGSLQSERFLAMLEPVTAFFSGLIACAIGYYLDPGINIPIIVLSSIIILIPGLSLTIGLSELSSRNLVSGTARVMDSIMQLFKLFFGAFLGVSLGFALFGENVYQAGESLPYWGRWLGVLCLSLALVPIFRVRVKHVPWAVVGAFIAFGVTVWSSQYVTQGVGSFMGAFALGAFANIFSRVANQPSSIVAMHALILLVPGSKTYMGLDSFISGKDLVNTQNIGPEVFIIFMSLVAGLIFANVIVPTRKAL